MNVLNARQDSFQPQRIPKNPANKSTSASNTVQVKWPHPLTYKANPTTLAEAGFIYAPTVTYKDNVACFLCKKELNGWGPEDDPSEVHYEKCSDTCAWASVKCGLVHDLDKRGHFISADPSRVPSSKAMEKSRLETFISWPHEGSRGHGANSKKMAKAGFVYTPESHDDDSASCLYCGILLGGWESGDNPMEEHHKRDQKTNSTCVFFTAGSPLCRSSSKPPSRSGSKPKGRPKTTRAKQATTETEQSSDEEVETLRASTRTTRSARTESNKLAVSSSSRRAASKSKVTGSEIEEQSGSEIGPASKKKGRATKGKGKIAAIVEEEEEIPMDEEELESQAPLRKSTRGKAKAKEKSEPMEVDVVEKPPQRSNQTRRQTRSRAKAKVESDSDAVVPNHKGSKRVESELDDPPKKKARPPAAQPEGESSDTSTMVKSLPSKSKHPPSRAAIKAKKAVSPPQEPDSSDAFEIPKTKARAKPRALESESEDVWQSALEDSQGAPQVTKSTNKAKRKPSSAPKAPNRAAKSSTSQTGREGSILSSKSEQEQAPPKKSTFKGAPFHDKGSNQKVYSEVVPHSTSRTSVGSKENALGTSDERDGEQSARRPIIDVSDDEEVPMRRPVSTKETTATVKLKKISEAHARKAKQTFEIVLEKAYTPQVGSQEDVSMEDTEVSTEKPLSHKALGKKMSGSEHAMDVDTQIQADPVAPPPSTPPRATEPNPFSLRLEQTDPLSAFQAPYGKLSTEAMFDLDDGEKDMTIEEWTKRELEIQLEKFKIEGYRRIEEFKEKAREVRRQIEAL